MPNYPSLLCSAEPGLVVIQLCPTPHILTTRVPNLSSSQLMNFIRFEGRGGLLCYLLVLRCSMHMLRCLSMPSMPYCSVHMPIGWNGLSMPTEVCSVHMPIVITKFKARGVKQDSVPYIMKVILTQIPIECGVVHPNVY